MVEKERAPEGAKKHSITLISRATAQICGVSEVESFDEESVILQTDCGRLTLEGAELRVGTLDIARGELAVSGRISALYYSESAKPRRGLRERFFGG